MNFKDIIILALAEDVGDGDHSSMASISEFEHGAMELIAKEEGIIAGIEIAENVFHIVDPKLQVCKLLQDGDEIKPGNKILTVEGKVISMLTAERTVLNFLQRMSGIATSTRFYVNMIKDLNTKLLDTRKTTPAMRYFEKYAVRVGGAVNHRFGLFDMIMLKDNHIDFAGGIEKAIDRTKEYLANKQLNLKIEIETRSLDEVKRVLKHGGVDRIMLDNFTPAQLKEAVQLIDGKYETEASGGITKDTLREYALTGVDYISVGALTHHIKSLDLSLKFLK